MSQDFFSGYPCRLVHAGGNLDLVQLRGVDKRPGRNLTEVIAGGDLDRKAVILSHSDPAIEITTADLAAFMATISASVGLKLTATSTFRLQMRDSGGAFDTGANHVNATLSTGFCALDKIQARQDDAQQAAFATLKVWPFSTTGAAAPLTLATGQAIAAPNPAYGSQFYLGPCFLGATELEGLLASEVDYGIQFRLMRASGDPHAAQGFIYRRRPIIRLTFGKISNISSSALFNAAIDGDDLKIYYWKGVHGGDRVAVGSGAHVKIIVDTAAWGADNLSWSDDDDGNLVLSVEPTSALSHASNSTIP